MTRGSPGLSQAFLAHPLQGQGHSQALTYLPRRAPRAGGRCASSPSSSSAAASGLSWTPRGSYPRTPACVQIGECTSTDLQQKVTQLCLSLTSIQEMQCSEAAVLVWLHLSKHRLCCWADPLPLSFRSTFLDNLKQSNFLLCKQEIFKALHKHSYLLFSIQGCTC